MAGGLRPVRAGALFLLLSIVMLLFPASGSAEIPVTEVRVEGICSIGEKELLYLLDIEPGRPIERSAVTEGIKRAFLKGIFEQIIVETDEQQEGLLRVRVREKDFLSKVEVKGTSLLSKKIVKSELGIKEHDAIRPAFLPRLREELLKAIRERGFPDANVTMEIERTGEPYQIKLLVFVEEGQPLYVKAFNISGRPYDEVRRRMRLQQGDVYDQFRLKADIDRLEKYYREKGYLKPRIGPYRFEEGTVYLPVEPGDHLVVKLQGNENIDDKKLRAIMPFSYSGEVRDDLLEEAVARMLSMYHEQGYPGAQVAPIMTREDQEVTITFYVFEGQRVLVESIAFTGATIPWKKLDAILSLKEMKAYNPDILSSDLESIREFYAALGYIDAKVEAEHVEVVGPWARIRINVNEGKQVFFAGVEIEGAESMPREKLQRSLTLKVGNPYNEVDMATARRNLLTLYRNEGFLESEVDVVRRFEVDGAYVKFRVREGQRSYFGKTIVTGNRTTKFKVFRREFLYEEGAPFDLSRVSRTRQGLYKLNIFSAVDMRPVEDGGRAVDVILDVNEAKPGTVEFGFGYGQYERFRGFLDISYRNLHGMHRRVGFRTEQSGVASRYILHFTEPWLLNRPIQSKTFLLAEEREEKNIDTGEIRYRLRRYTANTGVEKQLTERVKVGLFYEYSLVETFEVQPDVVLTKEDTGTLGISSISPSIVYDTRDNPFDPQRGLFSGLTVKVAAKELVSETDFLKVTAYASNYHRLMRRVVLALSIKGGAAAGLRETSELPLVERFFLGGRNTVRGFDQDELGPKSDRGIPTGGNVFALGNLEFRIRVAGGWRLVTFLDVGNVWVKIKDINLGELRYTTGLGIQYNTPVGPLRLDYGHKIDREPGESRGEVHFSIGYAF